MTNRMIPAVRTIAAAAALCCAGLAQAQTANSVTLYGIADAGITSVSGLKGGTVTQLASGIMEGSRWGVKGNEDLGGGYRAIFTLESRVELDTGANSSRPISGPQLSERFSYAESNAAHLGLGLPPSLQKAVEGVNASLANEFGVNVGASGNRAFDRQAFVGLVTPFGGFLAGRQYTPAFETTATYDIMETQSGLAAGQIVAFPAVLEIRKSNSLAYRFVKDGISGSLMYAAGEVAGDATKGRMLGLNANYKADMFAVGFGYNTANNENGDKSLTTAVLGASMNFGSSKVSSFVAKITDDNPSNFSGIAASLLPSLTAAFSANPLLTPAQVKANAEGAAGLVQSKFIDAFKQDGTLFHIGYRFVTGPSTISLAFSNYNDNRPVNADVRSYGAAYTYALSKRTDLNAVLVHYDNSDHAQVAPGGNGYIGGITDKPGTDSNSLALGIRHRF